MPETTAAGMIGPEFVSAILTLLERREAELISWGFVDLSFSENDVAALLDHGLEGDLAAEWAGLAASGHTPATVVSECAEAHLIYTIPELPGRFRTRFAEGVRLIARLRQMFTRDQWATAPSLVSDVKVHLAPRRYPRRTETAAECWGDLSVSAGGSRFLRQAFDALATDADGRPLQFSGFQRRSFARIFSQYRGKGISGTVVSAGTGAGKTKAFYIPAFLAVAGEITEDTCPSTKVVAVYPRNVLLADQLREALAQAAKLSPVLERAGARPITFGALLGDAPPDANSFERQSGRQSYVEQFLNWSRSGQQGWVIPYLRSPVDGETELVWRDIDRRAGRTALYSRVSGAVPDVPDGILRITRDQIQQNPPDVLFLSIELLNQQLGNPDWARAFGISTEGQNGGGPRLLLLDEVHTYEGIPGAQASWVLRRWRHWSTGKHLHVVGLSATLKEAPEHLARVAGIDPKRVVEHRPFESELDSVDVEYNIALKGDPASAAQLLSTTIQTGMLLGRLLTPRQQHRAGGALSGRDFYASKVFGFTDRLDAVNRWYSMMLDAERTRRLASLRAPSAMWPEGDRRRDAEGQVWELPRELGYSLGQPLNVSRCSSQDPGANAESDLIVATSSLEVGFDDPDVGATLHHKAPRSIASFVQRKGRAGRRRGTRPWTVVVLSDYGADRWAFQNIEQFFQPEIEPIYLPVDNSHVMRMQAGYFLIDWVGQQIGDGDPYRYLGRPGQRQRTRAAALIRDLLELGPVWRRFQYDFRALFRRPLGFGGPPVGDRQADTALWDDPRPILRRAVPSLLRKLESDWAIAGPNSQQADKEDAGLRRPIPSYVPGATFGALDTGEVRITFERTSLRRRHTEAPQKRPESLPVTRALIESCPGNASKRFSSGAKEEAYWLAFSTKLLGAEPLPTCSVSDLFEDRLAVGDVNGVTVFQPQTIKLAGVPQDVSDSSRAEWQWRSQLVQTGVSRELPVLRGHYWREIVDGCTAFMHRDGGTVAVLRYTSECRYEIRRSRGRVVVGRLALTSSPHELRSEAVGMKQVVDGIVVRLRADHLARIPDIPPRDTARLRTEYFRHLLRHSGALPDETSVFVRDWLWQTSMSMLTATAAKQGLTLQAAQEALRGHRAAAAAKVLSTIFQVQDGAESDEADESRLAERIRQIWEEPALVRVIEELEHSLWSAEDSAYADWLRQRYVATIGQAFRAAAVAGVPGVSEDDLTLDVEISPDGSQVIFLTETTSGGTGTIELVASYLRKSPHDFHAGLEHYLAWCPREDVTSSILAAVDGSARDDSVGAGLVNAFRSVREARSHDGALRARELLRKALDDAGVVPSRVNTVSVVGRVLQPGTRQQSDQLIRDLNKAQSDLVDQVSANVDARVFSYCALQSPGFREDLATWLTSVGSIPPTQKQLYTASQHLLFEGCKDSCPECLDQYTGLANLAQPSRSVAARWLGARSALVSVDDPNWTARVRQLLEQYSAVRVVVPPAAVSDATQRLHGLLAGEVDIGFLLVPISVVRVERDGRNWVVLLTLHQAAHAYT